MNRGQLELALDDVRLRIPWEGKSPRELTRVALDMGVILKAWPSKSVSGMVVDGQLEFWPSKEEAPPYGGSPTLLPLP